MADYKDFIVRYDIIADVTKAAEGLQAIAAIAERFEGPMNALKTAISQVSQTANQLKQNSQITFEPKINVGAFNNQLRNMVVQVRSAAAEMHAAIYEALSGNAAGAKAAQKGITSAMTGNRSVAAIKKDIESYNKELDKLLGTPKKNKNGTVVRGRDGLIQMNKNGLAKANAQQQAIYQERLTNLEAQKRMFQQRIQQCKAELAVAEKLEKEQAAQQAKVAKAQSKTTGVPVSNSTPTSQPAKLTNVTPAVIREWKKAFGDAKSKALTVNIRGNATGTGGALTVIEQIQASLKTLQSQGTFNINPVLNTEGFAAAEAKLRQLAGLSAAVVAPFTQKETKTKTGKTSSLVSSLTKDEKTKLNAAQKQIKAWNEKIAPIQSRLDANRAIPEDQRTPAIKGQITKDTKTLAAYNASKAEQENIVKSLQGKSTAAAQSAVKTAKPFAIDIVGNISKFNVIAKPPVVPIVGEITKIQSKVTEAIPVNVKISGEQIAASLKTIAPTPILDVKVRLMTEGIQQQLQALSGQAKPVVKTTAKAPVSTTPAPTPHPVYTPPTFTAADEKQLNSLAAKYGSLATARDKAEKTMTSAKAKLEKSGGSNRAFDRYMAAQREHSSLRQQAMDVHKQLQPLMFKQFQSTAQRALTDEELVRGIGAQNVVNQLNAKKRLTAAQKTQLAEANQTLAALRAPAPAPTPAPTTPAPASSQPKVTAQPTKAQKTTVKNAITATVDTKNIISQIQSIPKQTIPVSIKLMWEKGAVGRQEQIKKLASNIPPVKLTLNTTAAVAKLEKFIAQIKAASPQNIKLTATGAAPKAIPAATPIGQQQPSVTTQSKKPVAVTKTPKVSTVKSAQKLAQPQIPPVSLTLNISGALASLNEFISKVKAASPQNIKLTAVGAATNTAPTTPAPATPQKSEVAPAVTGGSTQKGEKQSGHTGHQPLTSQDRYSKQRQQAEERARKQLADNRFRAAKRQEYNTQQQTWYNRQQAMYNKLFGAVSKPDPNWAYREQQQRAAELVKMREDARAAFAKPTPFEQNETATRQTAVAQSIAQKQRKAESLRAKAQNAMLPFAQNKEQLNMLTKHRRYFRQAVAATGIKPTPGMEAPRMLQYLQGVSSQMQKASVAVPWTLQSQINKLEGEVAKANGVGQPAQSRSAGMVPVRSRQPKSFFDRSRKWAYPFTGQTSFGVRTPMAVDMAKGMGVMFAIGGAMSAIGSSFSQAMEYQNTMRTTQAILQNGTDSYSQNSFKNMEATVRNVGVKTKFSAPEVASAARFLAMAGYDIDAINAAIRPIADLALIGDSDLGETADKMTNIMTTFQIAPERMREAVNIMATTATRSNTDLMMLAESAKYGGAVANMYGRNDPYLFADTMAIFGVMGNAGIQASSAGTALRMMYQNIFNPNKKQAAILQHLNDQYGISTVDANGQKRSMADIIIDMANQIPDDVMPDIVGKLFRITAQSGANSAIVSAKDIALEAAGGDANIATQLIDETNELVDKLSDKKNSKKQLSSLASLIQANRNSMNGNISGAIAEEKQNTIAGLWAQVTSTFTEGIVKSFENRQGGFEGMLKQLKDYLAKPETVQMMQNLMDMIIEIGKVMAWFVKIWANLYNAAPGLIKFWVVAQMAVTQMGTLIAPIISLIGVFDRLKGTIMGLAGLSMASGTGGAVARAAGGTVAGSVAGTAASTAALNAPFIVGHTAKGKAQVIRGNAARRANIALANNAILAGELALSGASRQSTLATLNRETQQHYAAVRERAHRIYGPARAGRAFRAAATALPTMASFAQMFSGLKTMLMGLLTSLAKAVGFLINPVALAVGAVAGLGYSLYKLKQRIDGTSEAQQRARAQANKAADQTTRELTKEGQWYQNMMSENIPEAAPVISSVNTERIAQYNVEKERFNQLYATIFNDFSKDASKQSINDVATKWRNIISGNPAYSLAIGNARNYDFSKKHKQLEYNPYNDAGNLNVALWNMRHADEDHAINQRNGMVQDALMIEGANDARTQQAIREITELRRKYLGGETTYKTETEYQQAAFAIRDKYMSQFTAKLPAAGMTPEQFQQTSNRSVYDQYQLGAQNLLDATINGQMGTLVGKMNAYQWLSETENKAKLYTAEWYNAIANIIGDYHVIYNAVSADGQQQANIELILSTLPNGRLNFTNILEQIRAKITNFNLTLQGFTDIIGTAYKMMAEAGIIDIKDVGSLQKQIRNQLTGAEYGDETPRQYYAQWIANNPNSEWVKAGITEKQYVDFVRGRSGETLNLGNRVVTRSGERQQMYNNISRKTANTIIEQNKHLTEKAKQFDNNNAGAPTTPTPTPKPTPAQDQQAYASAYDRAAARPTQVIFNINNLVSFDRTTVASSAEERDLIASMEERITGAVYQMFAEASNQAQRVMDLT